MRQRSICCQHGKCLNAMYPILKPIPQHFLTQILQDIPHWAEKSIYYNNIFSMAATKVDNGTDGKFTKIRGDSCVKIQGRIYHFIPRTEGNNGISYLMFDAKESFRNKTSKINAL